MRGGLTPAWISLLGAQVLLGPQCFAKKTEFSPPPPHARQSWPPGTDSRPNFLPPVGAQRFPGRGALCHVWSYNPQESLVRPCPWTWHLWAAGRPVDAAEWPLCAKLCVRVRGVEMKSSSLRNSLCFLGGRKREREGGREEERERKRPWKSSQP